MFCCVSVGPWAHSRVRACFLSFSPFHWYKWQCGSTTVVAAVAAACFINIDCVVVEEKANNITIYTSHDQCFQQCIISIKLLSAINWMLYLTNNAIVHSIAMLQNLAAVFFSLPYFLQCSVGHTIFACTSRNPIDLRVKCGFSCFLAHFIRCFCHVKKKKKKQSIRFDSFYWFEWRRNRESLNAHMTISRLVKMHARV